MYLHDLKKRLLQSQRRANVKVLNLSQVKIKNNFKVEEISPFCF